jgi:DNA-binding response OmpR family regulator
MRPANTTTTKDHAGYETLLVVEDDDSLRNLTKAILEARGFRVLLASNPDEVESVLRDGGEAIDLLLTDVVMPVKSGREIADMVLKDCPDVKVLYMSGYTSDTILHHGVMGADLAFIQKPFTPASLVAKIRKVLDETTENGAKLL